MASYTLRTSTVSVIFLLFSSIAFAEQDKNAFGEIYRFGDNHYSDVCLHNCNKITVIPSSGGFNYTPKVSNNNKRHEHDVRTVVVNRTGYDPLVGIALESQFLLQLYKLTDRFVLQSERDRVRREVVKRINELHGI